MHVQLPIEIGYRIARHFSNKSPDAKYHAQLLGLMVLEPNIQPDQLRTLEIPTLVIAGTKDMIRKSHTQLIFNSLPNAQLAWIPGDHFIANRQPAAFNARVDTFLKEHR